MDHACCGSSLCYLFFPVVCGVPCYLYIINVLIVKAQSLEVAQALFSVFFFVITDKKKISLSFMASVHRMYT